MKTITKLLFVAAFSLAAMTASAQWWNAGGESDYSGANQPTVTNGIPFLSMRATGTGNRGFTMKKNTSTSTGWFWQDGSDLIRISNSSGGFTPHIAIPTSGLVGMNTAAPAEELHIVGASTTADIRLEASGSKYLRFYEGTTQKGFVGHSGTSMILQNDEAAGEVEIDGQTGITLRVNNNTALDVDANGLVTIDKTSEALRLSGSGSYMTFYNGATYNGYLWHNNTNMYLNNNTATGSMFLGTGVGGIDMTIDADGEVGIGTTTPSAELEIASASPEMKLTGAGRRAVDFNDGATTVAWMSMIGTQLYLNNTAGGPVFIGGSDDIHLLPTGNVGIGTSSPKKKLEVVGQLMVNNLTSYPSAKQSTFTMRHYNDAAVDFAYFKAQSSSTQNSVSFGGGAGANYAATSIAFFTAGNTTTTNGTERMRIRGDGRVAVGSTTATHTFNVTGSAAKTGGGVWSAISDRRLKKGVREFDGGLEQILKINPVYFQYKDGIDKNEGTEYVGVIAQDMQKVAPYTVSEVENTVEEGQKRNIELDKFLTYDGTAVTYMLVNAVKELNVEVESKDERIEALETKNTELQDGYDALNDRLNKLEAMLSNSDNTVLGKLNTEKNVVINGDGMVAELAQNQPNPFTENTTIKYFLPDGSTGAHMNIFSAEGKVLKTVKIDEVGQGQINLKANSLPAGTYMYQLITDAGIVGSKSMVLIN